MTSAMSTGWRRRRGGCRFEPNEQGTRPFGLSGKISVAGKLRTIPSAPHRPGSRNSRCRAFGVGMGSPQGVQKRQSPVFPAPGRVFLKEIGMFAAFISLLGSLAQAHFVWNGDIVLNVAMSGGVSERGPRLRFRACHRRKRPFGLSGKISVAGKLRTIPSAPHRPGSRNSRCRAFGVGMGSPQGVQKRQSPVLPTPG